MNEPTQLVKPASPISDQLSPEKRNGLRENGVLPPLNYDYDQKDDHVFQLLEYWRAIRKHLWLIIGISILLPTLVAVYLIRQPDTYESQARIQVDLENSNRLLGWMSKTSPVVLNNDSSDPAYFNTQLQILTG